MKTNVGGIDRVVRIVAGAGLMVAAATDAIGAWGWIGAVPLITGLIGNCPAYSLLGISSCPMKKQGVV